MRRYLLAVCALTLSTSYGLAACSSGGGDSSGGASDLDGGTTDSSRVDATGNSDAVVPQNDANTPADSGAIDTGTGADTSPGVDAGPDSGGGGTVLAAGDQI